ncbi:MAG: undecaprenyl-phosphate glucose phosphotransferase [Clostridiales bacterium]|nr:undecaprenyl-phosphate glucose phosphotransferase [Clostridiales bacterium]
MINENQKSLSRLIIVLDAIMILFAFGLAFYIRFYTNIISTGVLVLSTIETLVPLFVGIPTFLIFYNLLELYNYKRHFGLFETIARIVRSVTFGILIILAVLFIFKLQDFSRWTLILFYGFTILFTTAERYVMRRVVQRMIAEGRFDKRCLVLGLNDISLQLMKSLENNQSWSYDIIGILDDHAPGGKVVLGKIIIGKVNELKKKLEELDVDVVMIALMAQDYEHVERVIQICEQAGVKTHIIPYYHRFIPAKPYMDDLDGLPVIDTRHVPLDNFLKSFAKRIFDIVFALIALILTSPVILISVIMTLITSPGPVIFKQERIGLNRKPFMMYKFRSMVVQEDKDEMTKWTTKDDPRKTWWGKFMRRMSIDELPQFVNVLFGDMSVVGPRPERPYFVEQFKETIPKYMIKHQVRPGITGWAQINGWRGDTSIEKRIEFDLYYIENWKMSLDIKIILLTVLRGFVNRNAY